MSKAGNAADPNKWRPIAILSVVYKLFAKILHWRLQYCLKQNQAPEQMSFRLGQSVDNALVILEEMVSKTLEWNLPLWIVSVDLRKAFD